MRQHAQNYSAFAACGVLAISASIVCIALLAVSYHRDISNVHRTTCQVTRCNLTTRYCGNDAYSRYSYTCVDMSLDLYYTHDVDRVDFTNRKLTVKLIGTDVLVKHPTCPQMLNYRGNYTLRCWFDERNYTGSLRFNKPPEVGGVQIIMMTLLSSIGIGIVGVPCIVCMLQPSVPLTQHDMEKLNDM